MVMIPDCDKITPGMIIAAARLDVPTIICSGGVMATGCMDGEKVGYTDLMEASGLVQRGIKSHEWLNELEHRALPGCGACNLLGTANSMNFLTEALGLCLPGATLPAMSGRKLAVAKRTGMPVSYTHLCQAVGIKNNKIVFVGSDEDIVKIIDEKTVVYDLKGRTLMPGLIDTHIHPILMGLIRPDLNSPIISLFGNNATSVEEILEKIRSAIKLKKPGEEVYKRQV